MNRTEAIEIIRKACKTKRHKEAFSLLFGEYTSPKKSAYKCNYYHELCSRCLNWPDPEDIEADHADDCCSEYSMAVYYMNQKELAETGKCKYFMEI